MTLLLLSRFAPPFLWVLPVLLTMFLSFARCASGYTNDPKPLEKSIDMLGKMLVSDSAVKQQKQTSSTPVQRSTDETGEQQSRHGGAQHTAQPRSKRALSELRTRQPGLRRSFVSSSLVPSLCSLDLA